MNTYSPNARGDRRGSVLMHLFALIALLPLSIAKADCIAVVTAGGGQFFWEQIKRGAQQAGTDLGVDVIVRGPINESDALSQNRIIDSMLAKQCKGFVIAPNSELNLPKVAALKQMGIPTVYIDRDFGGDRLSVVKTDNYKAGITAGQEMAKRLPAGSKIAIFGFAPGVVSTQNRERGFVEAAEAAKLRIVLHEALSVDLDSAGLRAFTLLQKNPDIQGIFTPNEHTALVVLNMRKRVQMINKVVHIGFDGHPALLNAVKQGTMQAIILQSPHEMAYQAVQTVLDILASKPAPASIAPPIRIIDAQSKLPENES